MSFQGPRSNPILWEPRIRPHNLDKSLRPKSGKWSLNLHGTILEGKSSGSTPPPPKLKRRGHDLKNQDVS